MHVIITGASSGIGASLSREFAAAGADLTLVARRAPDLSALGAGHVHVVQRDLSDPATCCDFLAESEAALGPPRPEEAAQQLAISPGNLAVRLSRARASASAPPPLVKAANSRSVPMASNGKAMSASARLKGPASREGNEEF